ncbi:MAG TPA: hypothetical protein PK987_00355 [Ferruginibacter sp.]|nr:hypothetical protein [Ferruginibacter sp.]
MYQDLKQFANNNGLSIADTSLIFSELSGIIISKIPQLRQVINDVITNADDELLQEHVIRLSVLIQQQESDRHKLLQSHSQKNSVQRIRYSERGELF